MRKSQEGQTREQSGITSSWCFGKRTKWKVISIKFSQALLVLDHGIETHGGRIISMIGTYVTKLSIVLMLIRSMDQSVLMGMALTGGVLLFHLTFSRLQIEVV